MQVGSSNTEHGVAREDLLTSQESLQPQSIAEMHARAEVSQVAKAVAMAAVCLVAGIDSVLQDASSLTWEAIEAVLANPGDLLAAIRNVPPAVEAGRMASSSVQCSKQCLEVVTPETLEAEPPMVQHMFFWVMAAANYYDVLQASRCGTAPRNTLAGSTMAPFEPVRRQQSSVPATRMSRKPSPPKAAVSPPPQRPAVSPTMASRMTRKPSPQKSAVSPLPARAAVSPTNMSRQLNHASLQTAMGLRRSQLPQQDAKLNIEQLRKETREMRAAEAQLKWSMRRDEERLRKGEKRADDKELLKQKQQTREERARHEEMVRRARRQAEHRDAKDYQEQKRSQKMGQKEEELQLIRDMYLETKDHSEWRVEADILEQAERPGPIIEEHLEKYQTFAEYNREERLRDEAELVEKRIMEAQSDLELKLIKARKEREMAAHNLEHVQAKRSLQIPGNKHLLASLN